MTLVLLLLVLHLPFLILVLFLLLIPMIPRSILMRKVRAWRLDNLELSGADCFVLDMLADNLPHTVMDQVRVVNNTNTKTKTNKDTNTNNLPHTVMDQVMKTNNTNINTVMDQETRNLTFFHLQLLGEISKRISPKPDPDMIDNHNQSLLKSTTAL